MNTKVKGLLKGLRYISQIFEGEKEEEMQIGHPTDVKHTAHIGWDGPSVTPPSWMTEFPSAPLSTSGTDSMGMTDHDHHTRFPSQDLSQRVNGSPDLRIPKPARRSRASDSPNRLTNSESPAREIPELPLPRPTRRGASIDCSFQEDSSLDIPQRIVRSSETSPVGSPAKPRQGRRSSRAKELQCGADSPPLAPPRRKKSGSKGDGTSRVSTRSKNGAVGLTS